MAEKNEIIEQIQTLEAEIRGLEGKRMRSQAALIEALVSRSVPGDSDLQFFRMYTAQIDAKREKLSALIKQLGDIKDKDTEE